MDIGRQGMLSDRIRLTIWKAGSMLTTSIRFPKFAVSMLAERMEHYGFTERPDSFMFAINGTVRVLNAYNERLYYIAYPGEKVDYDMVSNLNDQTLNDKFKAWMEKVIGNKMIAWIRKKIKQHQR